MLASVVFLLWAVTAVLAQDSEEIYIEFPTGGATLSTDVLTIAWSYNFDYDGIFTIELQPNYNYDVLFSTTVDAADSSTTLAASDLSDVLTRGTPSPFDIYVGTRDGIGSTSGYYAQSITMVVPTPTLTTTTVTVTPTPTTTIPTPSEIPDDEETEGESDGGGLSTGAKAGIGVGVGAGVLLLAAAGFILFRRRKRNEPPKTIREITVNNSPPAIPGSAEN
ncbi:hypothetical protein BDW59DRAFT_156588 [Aspergillus cavernicola]|uniref:Uncharacterized protein n=1 Tax=Aspergillus cavernicola TaxID=176166 RepID=A0ABR4J404_9EURO